MTCVTIYKGYFSDSSPHVYHRADRSPEGKAGACDKIVVELGLEQVKPWSYLGDMAEAVQRHAVKNGYSIVREIGGHGVGLNSMRIRGWAISGKREPACCWCPV